MLPSAAKPARTDGVYGGESSKVGSSSPRVCGEDGPGTGPRTWPSSETNLGRWDKMSRQTTSSVMGASPSSYTLEKS